MLVGCNTLPFADNLKTDVEIITYMADVGFQCVDLNLNRYGVKGNIDPFWSQSMAEIWHYSRTLSAVAKKCGLVFPQMHAPNPTFFSSSRKMQEVFEIAEKCICIASMTGISYIVIHPVVPPMAKSKDEIDDAVKRSVDYFCGFSNLLRSAGVKLAVENVYNWDSTVGKALPTVASTAECMCRIIDFLNEQCGDNLFVACLDTGHAMLSGGGDLPSMIHLLGNRLRLLHIHDNDGIRDLHLPPYTGIIDWDAVSNALNEIGYEGNLTLEVKRVTGYEDAVSLCAVAKKLKKSLKRR